MASAAILATWLLVAAYTDVRWRKIPNRLTYSGILVGLSLSGLATLVGCDRSHEDSAWSATLGIVPWSDSLGGCFACGGVMLLGYVLFPGAIGGGDLKLLALMGSFLGLHSGLESLLWTMIFAGCMAAIVVVWRVGALTILAAFFRTLVDLLRFRRPTRPEWPALKTDLFLSPSALAAAVLVRANEWQGWW